MRTVPEHPKKPESELQMLGVLRTSSFQEIETPQQGRA